MNEEALLKKRIAGWHRLDELCTKADRGFRRLSGEEVIEYVRLYRQASADLAQMMTHTSNASVVEYLNILVSRAYAQLYRSPAKALSRVISDSLRITAQVVRRRWPFVALSIGITVVAAAFAAFIVLRAPHLREFVVPAGMEDTFRQWKNGITEARNADTSLMATAMYAGHNPFVAIFTCALAIASGGVLTVFLLWENGMVLGALSAEMFGVGKLGYLYGSIFPHGVSELGGIFMAGAAGLLVGWAIINPGRRPRGESLRVLGKDSLVLICLGIVMTLLAAPVEGFFSFNPHVPMWAKVSFALVSLPAWLTYFCFYGRDPEPAD